MITIEVNERTKAGKALIATAKLLAANNKGIAFLEEDDKKFVQRIELGLHSETLTSTETNTFINKLKLSSSK